MGRIRNIAIRKRCGNRESLSDRVNQRILKWLGHKGRTRVFRSVGCMHVYACVSVKGELRIGVSGKGYFWQ